MKIKAISVLLLTKILMDSVAPLQVSLIWVIAFLLHGKRPTVIVRRHVDFVKEKRTVENLSFNVRTYLYMGVPLKTVPHYQRGMLNIIAVRHVDAV